MLSLSFLHSFIFSYTMPCSMVVVVLDVCRTQTAARVSRTTSLEILVHASLLGGYPTSWIILKHMLKEVKSYFVKIGAEGNGMIALPFRERGFEVRETGLVADAWPLGFGGGTQKPGFC